MMWDIGLSPTGWGWGGHWLFGGFFMIIVWAAIIFFIVWMVREVSGGNKGYGGRSESGVSALEILKERYAKGELTKEQFEAMKKEIMHS